jgi:hypothetical protein
VKLLEKLDFSKWSVYWWWKNYGNAFLRVRDNKYQIRGYGEIPKELIKDLSTLKSGGIE